MRPRFPRTSAVHLWLNLANPWPRIPRIHKVTYQPMSVHDSFIDPRGGSEPAGISEHSGIVRPLVFPGTKNKGYYLWEISVLRSRRTAGRPVEWVKFSAKNTTLKPMAGFRASELTLLRLAQLSGFRATLQPLFCLRGPLWGSMFLGSSRSQLLVILTSSSSPLFQQR
ncbi:hypothetical protein I7I51_03851 [Histoplasma capsulatum]|uniref:Uncharacterized protein n=1 Tax=Ajellomyces capsulatus TaxID=5037 RepID=A0A8A1MAN4_AJECA|nr:hypothetical protein I7I51_03851 [Histoplasma capsulatum]